MRDAYQRRARSAAGGSRMSAGALRSVLLTPNFLGADGVSSLSREIVRALPRPAAVIEPARSPAGCLAPPRTSRCTAPEAAGRRFLAAAACRFAPLSPATEIVCSHLHLAPAAALQALARRTGDDRALRHRSVGAAAQARSMGARRVPTSSRFRSTRSTGSRRRIPRSRSTDVAVCHPGLPDRPGLPDAADPPDRAADRADRGAHVGGRAVQGTRRAARHVAVVARTPARRDARRCRRRRRSAAARVACRIARHLARRDVRRARRTIDALAALYAQCRFFVMPSRDEGFGLVFLEAMRAGKACIGGARRGRGDHRRTA